MSKLKEKLERKVREINEDRMRMEKVREWIDGFFGKIICFKAPGESYHIVFTKERVELREGEYPSCEVYYHGDEEALEKVLDKELSASTGVKRGQLRIWGSLNEATKFEEIL